MNQPLSKLLVAVLLLAITQAFVGAAPAMAGTDDIVTTVEVEKELTSNAGHHCTPISSTDSALVVCDAEAYAGPLRGPADYPLLTVDVKPSPPDDFVVTIEGTPYRAGARKFRVRKGTCAITVTRPGKDPCEAKLDVTIGGPNTVACNL